MKRLALRILIASVAVAAVLGVYALVVGKFGEVEVRILLTSLTVSGTSILGMACGVAWERRRLPVLPQAGVVLALLACALTLAGIWGEFDEKEFWKSTATAAILAAACAHASLMSLAGLAPRFRWSLASAYFLALILALSVIVLMWMESEDELAWRGVGVLSVLLSAATIAVPVFHRMSRLEGGEDRPGAARFCPACGRALEAAPDRCAHCGARFRVEFDP